MAGSGSRCTIHRIILAYNRFGRRPGHCRSWASFQKQHDPIIVCSSNMRTARKGVCMSICSLFAARYLSLYMFGVWVATTMLSLPLNAETTPVSQDGFLRARQVTVGILADTQDQRMPEKPGKVVVRGTGVHLRDGYVMTARHTAEKHGIATGPAI